MIDDAPEVTQLMSAMRANLPLAAEPSPQLKKLLRRQSPAFDVPGRCRVDRVDYAGDEGGIVCRLDLGGEATNGVCFVSITRVRFTVIGSLGRAIAAYQRRRIKRLKRLGVA